MTSSLPSGLKEKRILLRPLVWVLYEEDVLAFLEKQDKGVQAISLLHCDSCIHKKEIESEWRGKVEQLRKRIDREYDKTLTDDSLDKDIVHERRETIIQVHGFIDEIFGSLVDVHNPEFGGKALHVDMLDKESGLKEKPLLPKVSSADAKQETKKELVCMDECFECDKNCNADNHGLYRTEVFGCEKPKIICPSCESKGAVLLANISCPRCEGKGYKEISSADAKGEAKE